MEDNTQPKSNGLRAALWLVVIIVIVTLGFAWSKQTPSETIKIGALLCLTGACADWGENSLKGIELAVEEINARGGVLGRQLEVVVQNSNEMTVAQAVSGYQQMVTQGIRYLIGPSWTPAGLAIAPIVAKDSVIITSPSLGVKEFNEAADNIFNLWPHDEIATRQLAQFAIQKGWKRAALFSSTQAWDQTQGNIFADEFKKLGGVITIQVEPHENTRDLRTEAIKIKTSNPDVVMYTNFTHLGLAAKELKRLGYSGHTLSILMDKNRVEVAENGLEGTIYAQYPESSKTFREAFERKYKKQPDTTSDTAYDVVYFYAKGMKEAKTTDVAKVKSQLNTLKDFSGASGTFTFDGKGGVEKEPVLWIVKDGEFELYKE